MDIITKRRELQSSTVSELEEKLGYRREVCEALALRGIDNVSDAKEFFRPNIDNLTPWQNYNGMQECCDRIKDAIARQERILIYGDYDCDGICATSILYLFLSSHEGVEVDYYLPSRKRDGYGLHKETLEEIAENYMPDLVITVDCGITAVEEIAYAQEDLGLEIIVTDHHEPQEELPDCICVDPKIDNRYDCYNELCGAGLVLRLCEAIGGVEKMMHYADLAALATIADIVPLVKDNRIIVAYGLAIINSGARQSIKLLTQDDEQKEPRELTSTDIAYKVIPKINAIGRLSEGEKAVKLFTDEDYFYIKNLCDQAEEINTERRRLTDEVFKECMYGLEEYDLVNNRIIVLHGNAWEGGVLGIVAAKIAETFRRPAIIISGKDDKIKGSGRSVDGINLFDLLTQTRGFLETFGGHAMACGVVMTKDNVQPFISACNICLERLSWQPFLPSATYDIAVSREEMGLKLVEDMSILEPFGAGNPAVCYLVEDDGDIKFNAMGKGHLKAKASAEMDILAFNLGAKGAAINANATKQLIVTAGCEIYKNRKYVSANLKDYFVDFTRLQGDSEYYAIRHLYQKRLPDKCFFDINTIEMETVDSFLSKGIYGTLLVCYNEDTFRKAMVRYGEKIVRSTVGCLKEINPYNAIILDPDNREMFNFYKRIIFLDKPSSQGAIDMLKVNKDCEMMYAQDCQQGLVENAKIVKKSFPTIERMREIFVYIRECLLTNQLKGANECWDKLDSQKAMMTKTEYYVTFFALFELGIIKYSEYLYIDKTAKGNMQDSKVYCNIKEEIEK